MHLGQLGLLVDWPGRSLRSYNCERFRALGAPRAEARGSDLADSSLKVRPTSGADCGVGALVGFDSVGELFTAWMPRSPAPAPRSPAPAPRYPAPASRYPAPASRYPAPASRYPAPASRSPARWRRSLTGRRCSRRGSSVGTGGTGRDAWGPMSTGRGEARGPEGAQARRDLVELEGAIGLNRTPFRSDRDAVRAAKRGGL